MNKPLTLTNVTKSYSAISVLDGVDLTLEPGEFIGLVGVNGAGKTTLIKGILDLNRIDSGEIHLFGLSHVLPQSRMNIAYLPERFSPPPYLNGNDYLRYMSRLHEVAWDSQQINEVLQALELDPAGLCRNVRTFSKGMIQKLGLSACILSGKQLLILDEPMSGLDPQARTCLKNCFHQLKQAGRSVFMSTHMLADVASVCDRMMVLHQGRLCYVGTPEGFIEQYGEKDLDRAFVACISQDEGSD